MTPADIIASKILFTIAAGFLGSKFLSRLFSKFYEFFMHRFGEYHYEIGEKLEIPISNLINLLVLYLVLAEADIPVVTYYGIKTVLLLAVAQACFGFAAIVEPFMKGYAEDFKGDRQLFMQMIPIVRDTVRITMAVVVVISGLYIFGIDIGPFVASAGLVGAAIAFAVQSIISDFFYGVVMLFDGRIRAGDFIKVGDYSGKVLEIGVLSTKIETWDSTQLTVPNSVIGKEYLENLHLPVKLSKIKMKVGVSYESNIKEVKHALVGILRKHPKILSDPKPSVFLTAMLDSAIEFTVIAYVRRPEDKFTTSSELREMIIEEFRKRGIDIPYPIQTIYLKK